MGKVLFGVTKSRITAGKILGSTSVGLLSEAHFDERR